MTKITNAALVAACERLLAYIKANTIPYVYNGMTLQGMDCQGLVDYLRIDAGMPRAEVQTAGSNDYLRQCVWRGTIAECIAAFGCIPGGAALFIWIPGYNAKYNDNLGTSDHIGIVWGKYKSLAASASRSKVIESNFAGKAINGGWNYVGLLPGVDYGLTAAQLAMVGTAPVALGDAIADDEFDGLASVTATATPAVTKWGVVVTPDGNPVKAREQPKKGAITKYSIPNGMRLMILGESGGYYKVMWQGKARWVQTPYVQLSIL